MPAKRKYTKEMLSDLGKMTDKEFGKRWGINRIVVTRNRNSMGISSFLPQSNIKRKIIDGIEHKWCPMGGGHWTPLSGFKKSPTRAGGYRGVCHEHEKEMHRNDYHQKNGKEQARKWRASESGKQSLRRTWRKQKALKDNAFVKWDREDEIRAYDAFGHGCAYCGDKVPFIEIEFDHFVPVSKGGKTEPGNMLPSCLVCNHGVGGKFSQDARDWIFKRFHPTYAKAVYEACIGKLEKLR